MPQQPDTSFVICVSNENCDDLEVRKIYEVIPDRSAEVDQYIRVIDESGEDYLYPARYFRAIDLPVKVRESICRAA
jgi:hypothetical protein